MFVTIKASPKTWAKQKQGHKKKSLKGNYLHTPTLEAVATLHPVVFGHPAEVCVNAFYWRAIKIPLKCPVCLFLYGGLFCWSQGHNEDFGFLKVFVEKF